MSGYNFGTTSGLAGMLGDYNSIKSGSYSKLMKKYYSSVAGASSTKTSTKKTNVLDQILQERRNPTISKEASAANSKLSDSVNRMKSAIKTLQTDSTYEDTAGGSSASTKVAASLKEYVDSYNAAISSSKKSTMNTVSSNLSVIQKATAEKAEEFEELGITINNDGTLSVNEEALKKADVSKVKELFSTEDAMDYGAKVSSRLNWASYHISDTTSTTVNATTASSSSDLKSSVSAILSKDASFATESGLTMAKDLVSNYNSTLTSAKGSSISGVVSNISSLMSKTSANKNVLSTIGISIGSDGKLSLNEDTFKQADEATRQTALQKYASAIETNASLVNFYASSQTNTSSTYGSNGMYTSGNDIVSSLYSGQV